MVCSRSARVLWSAQFYPGLIDLQPDFDRVAFTALVGAVREPWAAKYGCLIQTRFWPSSPAWQGAVGITRETFRESRKACQFDLSGKWSLLCYDIVLFYLSLRLDP